MPTIQGVVRGEADPYIRLDAKGQLVLGRTSLTGPALAVHLSREGYVAGDAVVVLLTEDKKITAIMRESEYSTAAGDGGPTARTEQETSTTVLVSRSQVEARLASYKAPFAVPEGCFTVPGPDSGYILEAKLSARLEKMLSVLHGKGWLNLLLTGPSSTGKSTLAAVLAHKLGWKLAAISVGDVPEASAWVATVFAASGSTRVVPTDFAVAITTPKTVVLLDEVNRVPARVHNGIYDLLDERGRKYSPLLEAVIERAPDTLIVATANVEEENVGTFILDEAFMSRFPFGVRLEYPSRPVQSKILTSRTGLEKEFADLLSEFASGLQALVGSTLTHGVSNRTLIAAAELMLAGHDPADSLMATVAMSFDHSGGVNSHRNTVVQHITGFTPRFPRRKAQVEVGA